MEVIDKWVTECFIRCQHNPRVSPTKLLSALKFGDSPDCLKLEISSVLRDISDSLIRGTVDEGTLDILEILEKLQERSPLSESHKSAYCWTAAKCTLRFMWPLSTSDGVFTERMWTKRIGILKESGRGLVTQELLEWGTDTKTGVEDQQIREINVRYTAVSFLTQPVKEQWGLLGSSTLESVAQGRFLKRKAENNVKSDSPNDVDESTERLESDTIDHANEHRGNVEGEE